MSYRKAPKGPFFLEIICRFGPSEWSDSRGGKVETMITTMSKATLSLKMRKTSLCHVGPLLCRDGLALNTVRCLVPGCILTNERLLLGFEGQSTYGAVNSEGKNKLLCKNPKCANTTGSKFNQLSLVAEIQLPFHCTNKWSPSPCLFASPQNEPKSFYTQVMILYLLWRPLSFVTQPCPTQTQLSSCDQRSQRLSPTERKRDTQSFLGSAWSRQHFQAHIPSLLQNEMDDMFGFKCIFNGTASSHLSEFCGKVRAKKEERKKNILSGDWELGQARNYMPF